MFQAIRKTWQFLQREEGTLQLRRWASPVWFWWHCCWTLSQRGRGRERVPGLLQPLQSVHSLSLTCWVETQTRPPPGHLLREAFRSARGYCRLLCSEWEESSTVA